MHYRSLAAFTGLLALTGAPALHAQDASLVRFKTDSIANDRAAQWAAAARVIHCGPAPLTERPGIQAEFARPHVAPLESAFADAARVNRSVASLRIKNPR